MIGRKQLLSCLGLLVAWLTLVSSDFGFFTALFLLGVVYLVLRFATKPLSRVIARLDYSIRWKFELAIFAIAGLFLLISMIQIGALNFMHTELHEIQELEPSQAIQALNE